MEQQLLGLEVQFQQDERLEDQHNHVEHEHMHDDGCSECSHFHAEIYVDDEYVHDGSDCCISKDFKTAYADTDQGHVHDQKCGHLHHDKVREYVDHDHEPKPDHIHGNGCGHIDFEVAHTHVDSRPDVTNLFEQYTREIAQIRNDIGIRQRIMVEHSQVQEHIYATSFQTEKTQQRVVVSPMSGVSNISHVYNAPKAKIKKQPFSSVVNDTRHTSEAKLPSFELLTESTSLHELDSVLETEHKSERPLSGTMYRTIEAIVDPIYTQTENSINTMSLERVAEVYTGENVALDMPAIEVKAESVVQKDGSVVQPNLGIMPAGIESVGPNVDIVAQAITDYDPLLTRGAIPTLEIPRSNISEILYELTNVLEAGEIQLTEVLREQLLSLSQYIIPSERSDYITSVRLKDVPNIRAMLERLLEQQYAGTLLEYSALGTQMQSRTSQSTTLLSLGRLVLEYIHSMNRGSRAVAAG